MKRFKTQQAFFVLIMLAVSFLLFTGCNSGSDEVALVVAQVNNVPPGDTCTAAGPKVTSSTPIDKAEGISIETFITATFDEAMKPDTLVVTDPAHPELESLAFTLRDDNDTTENTAGTVAYDALTKTATFTPSAALHGDSWYTATITTYAKNAGGTALGCNYQWKFKTVAP